MYLLGRGFTACLVLGFMLISVVSCQNFSSFALGTGGSDSLTNDLDSMEVVVQKPSLLDTWDSLQRNQITFVLDTINPIDIETQKKILKDSLKREFDKHPKHVYLTFDDGPLVGSFAIDSLAKAKNIKVSAFLVGRHATMGKYRQRDLARYKENPLVACYNHSYSHGFNRFSHFYSNPNRAYEDFVKNQKELGLEKKVARLPGRNIWIYDDVRKIDLQSGSETADSLFANGYDVYGWDVEWRINSVTGVPYQSQASVYQKMKSFLNNKSSQTPNNVVLLMHDDMLQTKKGRALLSSLIDSLLKENYQFEFMEDYPIRY